MLTLSSVDCQLLKHKTSSQRKKYYNKAYKLGTLGFNTWQSYFMLKVLYAIHLVSRIR